MCNHDRLLGKGETINGQNYVSELKQPKEIIMSKRTENLKAGVLLLQDNTPVNPVTSCFLTQSLFRPE